MIKPRKKICKSCNKEQYLFSRGRCKSCAQREDYKPLNKLSVKTAQKNKKRSQKRSVYFEHHIQLCTKSEESGVAIPYPTKANICHIFPKRRYFSVEDNFLNYVYLTLEEHTLFDKYLDTFNFEALEKEFPNSWKKVCTRIKKLLPLISESGRLVEEFKNYIKWQKK